MKPSASISRTATALPKYTSADLTTLVIGDKVEELVASGHVLSARSDFFKVALKKEWIKDQKRTIKLSEEHHKTAVHYVNYIYGQGLPTKGIDSVGSEQFKDEPESFGALTDLYLFGERTLDSQLQTAIIREIIRLIFFKDDKNTFLRPEFSSVNRVFDETPARSLLRRLLVDIQVKLCTDIPANEGAPHPDFILEVARSFCDNFKRQVRRRAGYEEWIGVELQTDDYLI